MTEIRFERGDAVATVLREGRVFDAAEAEDKRQLHKVADDVAAEARHCGNA